MTPQDNLINFGEQGSLISKMPDGPAKSVAGYLGQHVADAVNGAWNNIKSDWEAKNADEAAAKTEGVWERTKHLFHAQILAGKLPLDAFGAAMSGITGLLDVPIEGAALGMQAAHHAVGADVSLSQEKNDIANDLWALAPAKGATAVRPGFPAGAAPRASELNAGRAVLATMKTGEPAVVKGSAHMAENLGAAWAKTGEDPLSLVQRAHTDPVLREALQTEHPPKPPEGSSVTKDEHGDMVIPKTDLDALETALRKHSIREQDEVNDLINSGREPREQLRALVEDNMNKVGGKLPEDAFDKGRNDITEPSETPPPGEKRVPTDEEKLTEAMAIANTPVTGGELPADAFDHLKSPAQKEADLKTWERNTPINSVEEASAAIGTRIAQPTIPGRDFGGFMRRVYDELFDDQAPWKRLVKAARDGKPLPAAAQNGELLEKMAGGSRGLGYYGLKTKQIDHAGQIIGPGLEEILKPVAGTKDFAEFEKYALARRDDADLQPQGIETGLNHEATRAMANDPAMRKKYEPILQKLIAFQNNDLKLLHTAGFLDDDRYAAALADNPTRVPFQRQVEKGGTASKGTPYNPVPEIKGSGRLIMAPVEPIMRQHMVRTELAMRNLANRAVIDELIPAGLAEKTAGATRPIHLDEGEIERIVAAHGGEVMDDFEATIYRHFKLPVRDDELPIFRDGKLEAYKLADPEAVKVLRGMGQPAVHIWTELMRKFAAVQRGAIALNPAFSIRQVLYDIPFQHIVTPDFRNTAADFLTGVVHGFGGDKADAFMRSGAWRPIFDQVNDTWIKSKVQANYGKLDFLGGVRNVISTPLRALQAFADFVYTAQRRGRFIRESAAGATREEAADAAMKATFHTGEKGSWSRQVNLIQPFFAAYMNTLKRVGEAFKTQPVKTTGKALAAMTTPVIANYLTYKDEDWYKETPQYMKDRGLVFPPSHEGGDPYYLPMIPGMSIPFVALPLRMMMAMNDHDPHAFDGFAGDAVKGLIPWQATYNMMLPVIENIANFSYFKGHPQISHYARENYNAPEQYTPYTSETAKGLSRFLDDTPLLRNFKLAPWQIDNLIQGWGGQLGQKAVQYVDKWMGTGDNAKPEDTAADNPWFGSFRVRYPSANAQSVQTFDNRYRQFEKDHGSLEVAMKNNDMARFQELVQRNPVVSSEHTAPKGDKHELAPYMRALRDNRQNGLRPALRQLNQVNKAMTNLYQMEHNVRADDSLSAHDKRQLLDQAYGQMVMASRQGNDILDALGYQ